MPARERVDLLLVARGLAPSREKAQALILAGQVYSGDSRVDKAGHRLPVDVSLDVREGLPYVGRGGLKLEAGLDRFGVDPAGKRCLDVGASTGGFTDCLLQRDAARVFAVDVGYGQLAWKLRSDVRVTILERTNFRTISDDALPHDLELAVVDVSFISLGLILPRLWTFLGSGADAIVLVKPQFEAGRKNVGKGGIVRDPGVRTEVLAGILAAAEGEGFEVRGSMDCPVPGADGNVEFLAHLFKT
ncbi:MAG TPA: TlyA family RNA methyltransferase [Proteobacteria bacterium]|nr:hemolysin A [bacterium BMS3Abin14]HDL52723.1 TlyA family RNA methyltransferase [Pseudomonadota bacterium]